MYLPGLGLFLLTTLIASSQQTPDPDIRLASETAPPGATIQLKLFLATPRPLLNANLTISLDPAFFGDIQSVAVFSAAGDAAGQASVQGRTATLEFSSVSGGIGRLSALPVAVVNVPLLPTLRPGASVTVTASANSPWKDAQGVDFTPRFQPAPVTAAGALSLRPPTPLADLFPKDSLLTLEGTGFTPATAAEIDGAAIAETAYVSPERIRIKLSGPTTLSGKRIRLRNPSGDTVQHYAAQPAIVSASSLPPGFLPLPPLQVATDWATPAFTAGILIQNPHPQPVEITIKGLGPRLNVTGRATRQLQSGQSVLLDIAGLIPGAFTNQITAPVPIRVSWLQSSAGEGRVLQAAAAILPASARLDTGASQLDWVWQPGEPAPAAKELYVCSSAEELNFSVQAATASGGPWLSAPASGRSIFNPRSCLQVPTDARTLEIRVNPAGLAPGTYAGTLTLTPEGNRVIPTVVNVQLIVSEKPYISASVPRAHFNFELGKSQPPPQTVEITSNGSPAEFTAQSSFENAPPWLTLSPTQGVTPASLTLTFDPVGLGAGNYIGAILVRGPANTLSIPVSASVYGPPTPRPVELNPSPDSVRFSWRRGADAPEPVRIGFPPIVLPVSFTVRMDTPGAAWLSAFPINGPGVPGVGVRVNPAGLSDGVYRASVIFRSDNPDLIVEPVTVPVELTVWSQAPPLSVSPPSVEVNLGPGNHTLPVELTIATGTLPVPVSVTPSTISDWFRPQLPFPFAPPPLTPAKLVLNINAAAVLPGVYTASVRIAAGGQTVDVPVTLRKTGLDLRPTGPPFNGAIVNGASAQPGPVSPGGIVTLHGFPLAPLDDTRRNVRVLFDGVPAPLLYVSASQINAVVPYQVAGRQSTVIEVEAPPLTPNLNSPVFDRSPAQTLPVAPAAPALFTLSGTGAGQAAALNQDNALNGPQSPASRGSVVQLYATGEGLLSPPQETGAIAESASARPVLPVRVTIGGIEAQVLYAGPSPGSIFGLVQVNAVVPAVPPGAAVPVVLRVGDAASPNGVTISIK